MSDTPERAGADPGKSRPKRSASLLVGNVGPVRAQFRRDLAAARAAGRMSTEHEIRALLAERYAAYVDRATSANDGRSMLVAGEKLLELLRSLPFGKPAGGDGTGDGADDRGRMLSIIDSGPTVGDSAHA